MVIFRATSKILSSILVAILLIYQKYFSLFFGSACLYEPSCSHYAVEAAKNHHPIKALFLILKRLLKCRPFSRGGYDPVPPASWGGVYAKK